LSDLPQIDSMVFRLVTSLGHHDGTKSFLKGAQIKHD